MAENADQITVRHFDCAEAIWEHLMNPWTYSPRSEWVFRGHGDAGWELLPRAHRVDELDRFLTDEDMAKRKTLETREQFLLQKFASAANDAGLYVGAILHHGSGTMDAIHGWPSDSHLDALALAQHYGLPTRLLDWTKGAAMAAHFAATNAMQLLESHKAGDNAAIWAFNIIKAQRRSTPASWKGRMRYVNPSKAVNPNLHAQGGCFSLVSPIPGHERPPPLCAHMVNSGSADLLEKITFPTAYAARLSEIVASVGHVTSRSLFPGYRGVVDSLQEDALRRRLLQK